MRLVRGRGTRPETIVRMLLTRLGCRYRLHDKDLPGHPDFVFHRQRKVIFINGCFWHRHHCPAGRSCPTSNRQLWREKFAQTVKRDKRQWKTLRKLGWRVLVLWECQMQDRERLTSRVLSFLGKQ
jgi:DNA mismatch endonuclease (patch repair protein)